MALKVLRVDATGNAAALDVAALLQLTVGKVSLGQQIANGDMSALKSFATNPRQLEHWRDGFMQALSSSDLRTHTLAKQVYFPLSDGSYHLISPLFASSLAQALYELISNSRFSEEAKQLRQCRREKRYSDEVLVQFRDIAVQSFGGANQQNISSLNSSRGGKAYLLDCQPPNWTKQHRPPINRDAFWQAYDRRARGLISRFKLFLESLSEASNNLTLRSTRAEFVDDLIEHFLSLSIEIQHEFAPGWSSDSQLSRAERFWLDPWNGNPAFQRERETSDWVHEIAAQFAFWLNRKLTSEHVVMKDAEYREWSKVLERKLMSLRDDVEALA